MHGSRRLRIATSAPEPHCEEARDDDPGGPQPAQRHLQHGGEQQRELAHDDHADDRQVTPDIEAAADQPDTQRRHRRQGEQHGGRVLGPDERSPLVQEPWQGHDRSDTGTTAILATP